jgi:hypothetical protein
MKRFPILIVDNFFDRPDFIIEYSKTLKYFKPNKTQKNQQWPGVRTKSINYFNEKLFQFILLKTLSYYYSKIDLNNIDVIGRAFFSKTTIKDQSLYKNKDEIHKDCDSILAGVIYLNNNNDFDTGTSIYDNDLSLKTKTSNLFNSMICYDTNEYHGPSNLTKDRLTIPFFIDRLNIKYPYDRSNELKGF